MDTLTEISTLITTMIPENVSHLDSLTPKVSENGSSGSSLVSTTSTSSNMAVVYVVLGAVGMVGNLLVAYVLLSTPALRTTITNTYIISQSVLDALASMSIMWSARIDSTDLPFTGLAAEVYCRVWLSKLPLWGLMLASTYNLVVLTIERYLNVVHPIWHKTHFSLRVAYTSIALVAVSALFIQCINFIPTCGVVDGVCRLYYNWPSQTARQVYGCSVVFMRFFIPLFVFLYTYSRIAYVIHKKVKQRQNQAGQEGVTDRWSRGRRNAIKTMALVSLAYVLCMATNQIYYFMFSLGYPPDYTSDFYHSTVALVYLNSTINPFIYVLKYEQFIKAAKKNFCARCTSVGATNSIEDASTAGTATGSHMPAWTKWPTFCKHFRIHFFTENYDIVIQLSLTFDLKASTYNSLENTW